MSTGRGLHPGSAGTGKGREGNLQKPNPLYPRQVDPISLKYPHSYPASTLSHLDLKLGSGCSALAMASNNQFRAMIDASIGLGNKI